MLRNKDVGTALFATPSHSLSHSWWMNAKHLFTAFENWMTWKKMVVEEVQPARCIHSTQGGWACIGRSIYTEVYHQQIPPVVSPPALGRGGGGGGAMGGSLLVLFGSLVCVGWKGGRGVFRQCSNGLQTVRITALSHAQKARTPPHSPTPKPSLTQSGKDRKHLERKQMRRQKEGGRRGLIKWWFCWRRHLLVICHQYLQTYEFWQGSHAPG